MKVLYIRDIVADCVPFAPMFVHHVGGAVRDFYDQCKDKSTTLGKHPTDYELYELGDWDDKTATMTLLPKPRQVAVGRDTD